jgi:hypothetical protein
MFVPSPKGGRVLDRFLITIAYAGRPSRPPKRAVRDLAGATTAACEVDVPIPVKGPEAVPTHLVHLDECCQRSLSHLALMGFRPLQRVARRKRPAPDLPHPAVQHSQVFSTSQCIAPPPNVPALFHAGSTRGILDPPKRSPSRDRVPFSVSHSVLALPAPGPPAVAGGRGRESARLHGFDPPGSPFVRQAVLPCWRSRCSPGFRPLQGVPPLRLRGRLHALFLLRTFGKNISRRKFPYLVP